MGGLVKVKCKKCGYESMADENGWFLCPICGSMYETKDVKEE